MVVTVTKNDIKAGFLHHSFHCPIAKALKRATKRAVSIGVGYATVYRSESDRYKNTVYILPDEVVKFIRNFDRGLPVEPFTFTL